MGAALPSPCAVLGKATFALINLDWVVSLDFSSSYIVLQGEGRCAGSNDSDPHGLTHLNAWFPVDLLGKIRRCGLVGVCASLGVGFEVSKAHTRGSIYLLPVGEDVNLPATAPRP